MKKLLRAPALLALFASVLGLVFSAISTIDYVKHLDRQLHDIHCSFIPGLAPSADAANPCRAAMYSTYSALFRETWWGGIPIALPALGVYAFFIAFALALLVGGSRSSVRSFQFFGIASLFPLLTSVVMGLISAIKLGVFCKTCVGMYVASILLAVGGIWAMVLARKCYAHDRLLSSDVPDPAQELFDPPIPLGKPAWMLVWATGLGICVAIPTLIYVSSLPDYRSKLVGCGKLADSNEKALVQLATVHPKQMATMFEDPLCPTCKALHERLVAEGAMENLSVSLALMPLDNTCNDMLDRPLHPGSCVLAKAVLCSEPRAREALEWMYTNQEELAEAGKKGEPLLRARIRSRFGNEIDACIDDKKTSQRLSKHLQFAITNRVPVSTPQFYLNNVRICDEDTDLGLRYTLNQLAPEVLQ